MWLTPETFDFSSTHSARARSGGSKEPDNVGQPGVELLSDTEFETLDAMRLKLVLAPDPLHRGRRQSDPLGQAVRATVGRRLGLAQCDSARRLLLGRADRKPDSVPSSARSDRDLTQQRSLLASLA